MNKTWQAIAIFLVASFGFAAMPSQGPEVKRVMRQKLVHTHKVLEALVTSDWIGLEAESRELERLTNDPRWTVLRFPEYSRYSGAFVRAIQDLERAAAERNLDGAPEAYAAVALKCVECHRYVARARMAR